ncbi:MAG: gamma-glutamyltransferase [Alphaproteobacteria bacterium]|nr:gamma-glutamyltransferase [Alphaproteobacteria bacterium]MBM3732220.1 gamma-glutamyltransferase [Acidimicrobiia bacterium]
MRNFHLPGRSRVHANHGMAATSHPLATLAALDVLRAGGNAMDAAVAACAVQCVVEPQSTGIGGDCFVLYSRGGADDIVAFNGSGRAPSGATLEFFAKRGIGTIDSLSPHAVTVPGAVDAWARLIADHGTRDLGELLRPAIAYARDGYPVHDRVWTDWNYAQTTIRNNSSTESVFMPDGRLPAPGVLHRQPNLAATLERIAREGRDGFYRGPVAEDIVEHLSRRGGVHTMADFATAHGEYVEPIKNTYRGLDIYECPPNGQGIIALLLLNIVAGLEFKDRDPLSIERLHTTIEATRLAYADRDAFLADPAQADVPVAKLLSPARAESSRARIRKDSRIEPLAPLPLPAHADTVYLCVVDKNRNAASFINSLFSSFGTGLMAPRSGVVLHNRGSAFVVKPGHPNCIAPGKRPMHTIIPGMAVRDSRVVMPFGVMGGHYQAMGHAWFLTNFLDFGLDLQQAIDLPRLFPTPAGPLEVETGVPPEIVAALKRLGHTPMTPDRAIGGGQAIWIDWQTGGLTGASDPRKDGMALGY